MSAVSREGPHAAPGSGVGGLASYADVEDRIGDPHQLRCNDSFTFDDLNLIAGPRSRAAQPHASGNRMILALKLHGRDAEPGVPARRRDELRTEVIHPRDRSLSKDNRGQSGLPTTTGIVIGSGVVSESVSLAGGRVFLQHRA